MQVLVCSVNCAVPIKGSCLWKSNELSNSAGGFHIIFDASSARQNRRKHPSNAKGDPGGEAPPPTPSVVARGSKPPRLSVSPAAIRCSIPDLLAK